MKNKKTLYLSIGAVFLVMLLLNGVLFYSGNLSGEYLQTTNVWGQQSSIRLLDYNKQVKILTSLPDNKNEALDYINQAIDYLNYKQLLVSSTYLTKQKKEEINNLEVPELIETSDSGLQDIENYTSVQTILKRTINYSSYISQIPENALLMSKLLSGENDETSYLLDNIQRCSKDYYGMEYTSIEPTLDYGINMVIESHTTDILAVLTIVLIALLSYTYTKKELSSYVISTNQTIAFSVIAIAITIVTMYLTNLYLTGSSLALPEMSVSLQSLGSFYTCPYSISLGTFLIIWLASKLFTSMLLLLILVFCLTFKHKIAAALCAVSVLVTEYCLAVIPSVAASVPNTLQEINLFSGFSIERFFNRYLNIKLGSAALPRLNTFLIVFSICFIILCILCTRCIKSRIAITRNQIQQSYYTEVDKRYQDTRRLWHDFNNHLITIKALYNAGNAAEANEYIDAISAQGRDYLLPTRTGREAVDLLLFQKNRNALESGIRIEFVTGCDLSKLHFADYDLCSLLGNLLDNALEACSDIPLSTPIINLKLEARGSMLFIFCQNPYLGERKQENGSYETTKKDTENHGIGLSSVKQVCRKYDGSVEFEVTENSFIVQCLLNSPE